MKTLLLTTLIILSTNLFASPDPTDSVKVERVDHMSLVPYYTPFTSMYYVVVDGVKIWKIAFAIIVDEGADIRVERKKGNARSTCMNSTKCDREWKVNIYSKDYSANKKGESLEKILFLKNSELKRRAVIYDNEPFQLCTFVMNMKKEDGTTYGDPKESIFRLEVGEHPQDKLEDKGAPFTHQGGVVHWPGGN